MLPASLVPCPDSNVLTHRCQWPSWSAPDRAAGAETCRSSRRCARCGRVGARRTCGTEVRSIVERTRLSRRAGACAGRRGLRPRGAPRRHPEGDARRTGMSMRTNGRRDALVAAARAQRSAAHRLRQHPRLGPAVRRMRRSRRRVALNRSCSTAACPALILRVPMVLGEDDYASRALRRRARSGSHGCCAARASNSRFTRATSSRRSSPGIDAPVTEQRRARSCGPGVAVARRAGQARRRVVGRRGRAACRCRSRRRWVSRALPNG